MDLTTDVRDVILRGGSTPAPACARRRPPTPGALLAFFGRLSPASIYHRFHGVPSLGRGSSSPSSARTGASAAALVGTLAGDGEERIVALASWARLGQSLCEQARARIAGRVTGRLRPGPGSGELDG